MEKEFLVPPSGRVEVGHPSSWRWYLDHQREIDLFLNRHGVELAFTYAVVFDGEGMDVFEYARDSVGNILKDRLSGEARRLKPRRILYRSPVVY